MPSRQPDRISTPLAEISVRPANAQLWPVIVQLFGERGACGGCWCMYWRRTRKEFEANKGTGNRDALHRLLKTGSPAGVIAYAGEQPIGWCAIAPKADYPVLLRSRSFGGDGESRLWSVTCFFIDRPWRRKGISRKLLGGAIKFARSNGARVIEAYPHVPEKQSPDPFVWTGLLNTFLDLGFREVAAPSLRRRIVRLSL